MPANVETMFSVREVPWHGIGTIVEDKLTAEEALKASGLNWKVGLYPSAGYIPEGPKHRPRVNDFVFDPGRFKVVRETDRRILGEVGKLYTPLQNEEAFTFFDNLVGTGEAKYETAGSLSNGKIVWLTAKLPDSILIGGIDPVDVYLLLSNSHDGSKAVRVTVTPVRVVCQNTLSMALNAAQNSWSARHTTTMQDRIEEAREALSLTFAYLEEFEATSNELLSTAMNDSEFDAYLDKVTDELKLGKRVLEHAKDDIKTLYKNAENLENVRGTRWAALNATSEWLDWTRPRTDDSRVINTWFGSSRKGRQKALKLLR